MGSDTHVQLSTALYELLYTPIGVRLRKLLLAGKAVEWQVVLSSTWNRASWVPAEAGEEGAKGWAPARGSGVWVRHRVYPLVQQPCESRIFTKTTKETSCDGCWSRFQGLGLYRDAQGTHWAR